MSLAEISESDIESISSADTQGEKIAESDGGVDDDLRAVDQRAKHPRFYFGGGFIELLVEGTLYRVHDFLFTTNSSFWLEKLSLPREESAVLDLNVTKADMDALLVVLYNRNFQGHELTTYSEWESVPRLSTLWNFDSIRALAIDNIEPLASPLQKLVLGRSFDVPQWVQPALVSICMRKDPLTLAEGNLLSMADVIAIAAAREAVRQASLASPKEEDVSSYIASTSLCTDPLTLPEAPSLSTTALAEVPDAAPTSDHSDEPGPPALTPLSALSATPSPQDVHRLLSALLDHNYHDALTMVTEESVKLFVDVLTEFTTIWKDLGRSRSLLRTILRHGSENPFFISTGVKLVSTLPHIMGGGYSIQSYLHELATLYTTNTKAMDSIKTRYSYGDFALALHHVTMNVKDHDTFFTILNRTGSSGLTESMYEERKDNLFKFYHRLCDTRLLSTSVFR